MLCSVSPGATTCTPESAPVRSAARRPASPVRSEATRVVGGASRAVELRRGITRCWPGWTGRAGDVVGLHDRGDRHAVPARNHLEVSPGATVIGVPPSQVQAGGGGAGRQRAGDVGIAADRTPCRGRRRRPLRPAPVSAATVGSRRAGRLLCGIEPVVSLRDELLEPKISEAPGSLLQFATPNRLTKRQPYAATRPTDATRHHTRSHATNTSGRINNVR